MIGRLLQTAANTLAGPRDVASRGNPQQNSTQLESNIEEAHTRDLLYPDIDALRTTQHSALSSINGRVPATPAEANSFDDRGGLDISFAQDVRVIIAQDTNVKNPAQILFDSKPKRLPTPQQEHGPAGNQRAHNRGKSITSPPSGPVNKPQAVASPLSPLSPGRPRKPFGPGQSVFGPGGDETSQGRVARESKEEIDGLLTCIFGAPGQRIEPGTKLHILPQTSPEAERPKTRMGPGGLAARRSNLPRSSSAFDEPRQRGQSAPPATTGGQTSIMITRLFNVQLLDTTVSDTDEAMPTTPDIHSPDTIKGPGSSPIKAQPQPQRLKQKKTPPYAIAVIIQLPTDTLTRTRSNPPPGVVSLPSSYQSSAPVSPRFPVQPNSLNWMDIRSQGPLSADSVLSSQISYVLGNWALLSRNMHLLEISAKLRLRQILESIVPMVPPPVPSQGKAGNLKLRHPKPPSQQAVFVNGDCLQEDVEIRRQARSCLQNIADGLRTRRVTPGQSRWGAWREEARSISRWAGGKEQNFFFYVFMTAFLGHNTRWLEQLAPKWYRKRAARHKQLGHEDSEALPQRTVLVCKNKMDARRLVFLAASFLPTSFKNSYPSLVPPLLAYNESVLSLPTPREGLAQSGLRKSFSAVASAGPSGHGRSVSFSIAEPNDEPTEEERAAFGEDLGRRASEAGSVRSTFAPLNTPRESRKTSTSTLLADGQGSAQPVAHFSNVSIDVRRQSQSSDRPGSSASMASVALNQALRRSESAGAASVGSRLGNMVSGLWSSTAESDLGPAEPAIVSPDATPHNRRLQLSRGQSTSGAKPFPLRSPSKLEYMVEEAGRLPRGSPTERLAGTPTPMGRSPVARGPLDLESCLKKTPTGTSSEDKSMARNIPKRIDSERLPLHLAMNETDGFVDVSMPPGHSLATSLASSFASLRVSSVGYPSAYSSMTGLWAGSGAGALVTSPPDAGEHFSPYGSPNFVGAASPRPEKTPEVAGWLKSFHPDFLLQSVQPYDNLHRDVKNALRAEARLSDSAVPDTDVEEPEEWRDVASVLVADTSNFKVERVVLQRRKQRVRPTSGANEAHVELERRESTIMRQPLARTSRKAQSPVPSSSASSHSSLAEMQTQEQIITQPIMDVDPVLIDAFERVLAQVPNAELRAQSRMQSRAPPRVPSRAQSPTRSRPVSVRSSHPGQHPQSTSGTKQKQVRDQDQAQGASADAKQDSGKFGVSQTSGKESAYKQLPFAECRTLILGALEEITRSVIEERDLSERGGGAAIDDGKVSSRAVLSGHSVESTLREGVSRWLSNVEEGPKHW